MRSMESYSRAAMERAMQVQEAMAKEDHMVAGAVDTSLEPGARGVQMVELFVETEVAQIVEQSSFRKKQANCSYCLRKACFQ
jgi:hypothetical protein